MAEFDWALANMGGKRKSMQSHDPSDTVLLDGEAKALKDEVSAFLSILPSFAHSHVLQNELKGLGQLLLDDCIYLMAPSLESKY